jgi:ribosomal protein S18 acetylase RimI-like enzyme
LIEFSINKASLRSISKHLNKVNDLFVPVLSSYVNIDIYSKKIFEKADRIEFWKNEELVGLLAFYINPPNVFITNLSLDKTIHGLGYGVKMLDRLFEITKDKNIKKVSLEVNSMNQKAVNFYKSIGFEEFEESDKNLRLIYNLK